MRIAVNNMVVYLLEDETLVEKSGKTYTVDFTFDKAWDGYKKGVMFKAGSITEKVVLSDDSCVIPLECLEEGGLNLMVRVIGAKVGRTGAVTISTPWSLISRILYETVIEIPPHPSPIPEGEVGRLCEDFVDLLVREYTEEQLKNKSLDEVIGNMDGLDNTATDEQVDAVLDEVWGPD